MNSEKNNSIPESEQNSQIGKNKKKINLAILISISALLTSVAQLIITSPFFLDAYNTPKIIVTEGKNWIGTGNPTISTNYQIKNKSNKTATNLLLAIDVYESTIIGFIPENAFELIDSVGGYSFYSKRLIYRKKNLIPDENVTVFFANNIDDVAHKIKADSLLPFVGYNCQELVPKIAELKTDLGYAKIERQDKYILTLIEIIKVGSYKLKWDPTNK